MVAAALWYAVGLSLAAKAFRAMDLASSSGTFEPLLKLPLVIGEDLVVAAVLGAAVAALRRWLSGWAGARLVVLLLAPWALLVGMNVMSYRLTGTGISWQRLRGDEGATLTDLDLLSTTDLVMSLAVVVIALVLMPALHLLCRRAPHMRRAAHPLAPAVVGGVGVALAVVAAVSDVETWGLEENPVVLLVESGFASEDEEERVTDRSLVLDREGWRALHQPSRRMPAPSVPKLADARVKNVVVMLAEGIPYRHTSWGAAGRDSTPNLSRRAKTEGLRFDRFYSNYHSSIQSIFSLVCSAYPPMYVREGNIVAQTPRIDCGELSEHLDKGGRDAGLFHGGRFAYYDKLSLLGNRGYDVALDAEHLSDRYPKRKTDKWGIDDRAVVDGTLDWIDTLPDGKPFGALLIPITAHYPYWVPPDVKPRFPGRERGEKFASAVAFFDETVERLIQGLEERGLYDDTLVVVLADHGEKVDPLVHKYGGFRNFYQQNLHVPLVLLNPKLFPNVEEERVSHRTGSIIDVMPTVLDVLGLPADERHFGQSLVSDRYEQRRVFFGAFSARNTFVGLIEGDTKFALQVKEQEPSLYDLKSDPDEAKDLAPGQEKLVEKLRRDTLDFYRANQVYFLTAPSLPESGTLHERILAESRIAVVDAAGTATPCSQDDEGQSWSCAGMGEAPAVLSHLRKVDNKNSRCLEVRIPPPPFAVELTLESPAKNLISGARVGIPDTARKDGRVAIEISVDGAVEGTAISKTRRNKMTWLQLKTAERQLKVRVSRSTEDGPKEACLLFSDEAWRVVNKPKGELDGAVLHKRN